MSAAVRYESSTTYVLRYLRVSSDEQADKGLSIPFQDDETTRYVLARAADGWVEDGRYVDVLSGKRDERVDYQRLLARARELRKQRQRVVVVVFRCDRFGRRLSERSTRWGGSWSGSTSSCTPSTRAASRNGPGTTSVHSWRRRRSRRWPSA